MKIYSVTAVGICLGLAACGAGDHVAGGEPGVIENPSEAPARGRLLELLGVEHEAVLVSGNIDLIRGQATLRAVSSVPSMFPYEAPEPGPFELLLYGADGEKVRTISFQPNEPSPEDGEEVASFILELEPPVPPLSRIAIVSDRTEFGSLSAGPAVPTIEVISPRSGEALNRSGVVEWAGEDRDGDPLTYSVLATSGDGQWRPVATLLTTPVLSLGDLYPSPRPGDELLLLVTVSDGLNSSWTVVGPVPII